MILPFTYVCRGSKGNTGKNWVTVTTKQNYRKLKCYDLKNTKLKLYFLKDFDTLRD